MKADKLIDAIKDEYIAEAENYSFQRNRRISLIRWSAAAAAVIALCAVLMILMPMRGKESAELQSGVSETSSAASAADGSEEYSDDPQTGKNTYDDFKFVQGNIYLSENEYPDLIQMTVNKTVTIKNLYNPERDGMNDGIHFHVAMDGCRIDAMTDVGELTAVYSDRNLGFQKKDNRHFLYIFGLDKLSAVWHPSKQEGYWDQQASIRLYAVKDNTIFMYALIRVSSDNSVDFTAELVEYENYAETGGIVITDDNRDRYYPQGGTVYKTCDINTLIAGEAPGYILLNVQQPISMRVTPIDTEKGQAGTVSFNTLPFSIPLVSERMDGMIFFSEQNKEIGFEYDPETCCSGADIYKYISRDKERVYPNSDLVKSMPIQCADEMKFLILGTGSDVFARDPEKYECTDYVNEGCYFTVGITDGEYIVSMASFTSYWTRVGDHLETIFIIDKYESYPEKSKPLGDLNDPADIAGFRISGIEKRMENIFGMLDCPDEDTVRYIKRLLRGAGEKEARIKGLVSTLLSVKDLDPYSIMYRNVRNEIKDVIDKHPGLANEEIAKIGALRSLRWYGDKYRRYTFTRLEEEICGGIAKDAPRISMVRADQFIEEFREKYGAEDSIETGISLTDDDLALFLNQFDELAGAPDLTIDQHKEGTYAHVHMRLYKLDDDSVLHIEYISDPNGENCDNLSVYHVFTGRKSQLILKTNRVY